MRELRVLPERSRLKRREAGVRLVRVDSEDVVEEQIPEIFKAMSLPVFDADRKVPDNLIILGAMASFINLIGDPLSSSQTLVKLFVVDISGGRKRFD